MDLPVALKDIPGAVDLHDWFGYWPSFHDAEIVSLNLKRKGSSSLLAHTWEMTKELDEKGHFVLTKHIVVEFLFDDVFDLNLIGFNQQNVIFELAIEKTDSGFRLTLDECYGLSGIIEAKTMSIRTMPGKPS
jgi:hypothetical protein